jgi:hypothetical protein
MFWKRANPLPKNFVNLPLEQRNAILAGLSDDAFRRVSEEAQRRHRLNLTQMDDELANLQRLIIRHTPWWHDTLQAIESIRSETWSFQERWLTQPMDRTISAEQEDRESREMAAQLDGIYRDVDALAATVTGRLLDMRAGAALASARQSAEFDRNMELVVAALAVFVGNRSLGQ